MAEADKIPKIDPAEVDLLIEKFEQNKLSDQDKKVISGLLRTLLYLVAELQDKKATLYLQEVVKCGSCNREYEAPLPEGVKPQKFDETADAKIVIIRYVAATPGFRLAGLQQMCGIPLPISTIHERCVAVAEVLLPIYKEMEKEAANAKILYGDDTWLKILELMKENEAKGKGERVGIRTTGIVAEREDGVKIALYLNGRRHTGENVERLLEKREDNLG